MRLKMAALLCLLCFITLRGGGVSAQNQRPIYVGLVTITTANAPILAASDGGYFKKYGLDVRNIVMTGSSVALSSMIAGEVSMVNVAGSGLINSYLAGADATMVAGLVNFAPYDLIVSKEISRIEDLKGKKLGIARYGGSADFLARWALEKHGLKPAKDVAILQTGGNPERLAGVANGVIQATLLEQAFSYQAKQLGLRSLLDYSTAGLDYQHDGVIVMESFLKKYPEVMPRFLKAIMEGTHRLKTDRAFGIKVFERHLRTSDAGLLQSSYDYYAPKFAVVPYTSAKGMKFLLDTIAETNPKAKSIKVEDMIDNSYLRDIEASGFSKQLISTRK
ncbi:MAG TPA: ABC transporter substrate-binding protein [Candidatus Binatia bacterium]